MYARFLLLALALVPSLARAQFDMGGWQPGSQTLLFADDVIVRAAPTTKSALKAKLGVGSPIRIIEAVGDPVAVLWGYPDVWYKVGYDTDKPQEGYIWGGLIGWGAVDLGEGECIVVGPNKGQDGITGLAKSVKLGRLQSSLEFLPFNYGGQDRYYGYLGLSEVEEGWNFDGGPRIVAIEMGYPACGYANGELYLFSLNGKLSKGFDRYNVGDVGVFACGQTIEWAAANLGTTNQIKLTQECVEYEWDDETSEQIELSRKRTESLYVWDGQRLEAIYEEIEVSIEAE